jgi:predicted DCC family thiol-disulfide oxidoreductase YuxK
MEDRPARGDWLILYDAECGLCQWLLAGILGWDRDQRLRPLALQRELSDAMLADLAPAQRMVSWHLISPSGERRSGGAAFPELLRLLPGGAPAAALSARFPGASVRAYRWVAEHRELLSKPVPRCAKRRARERIARREQLLE